MFKERGILFIYTETPLHAGSGTSIGTVDLPIQRERHTDYPLIQASGVKGALRDLAYQSNKVTKEDRDKFKELREVEDNKLDDEKRQAKSELANRILPLEAVFGPETDRADEHAGALSLTDARILLFPVRSLQGVFAWITCPFVLRRFQRDLALLGQDPGWQLPTLIDEKTALVTDGSTVKVPDDGVVLEEYHFEAEITGNQLVAGIAEFLSREVFPSDSAYGYWRERLYKKENDKFETSNLVILSDNAFRDFVRFSTEVLTRIKIDEEKGTVQSGALWSEEHLPSDTLLYTLALATAPRTKCDSIKDAKGVLQFLDKLLKDKVKGVAQFGGDETVGRGLVRLSFTGGNANEQGG